jgi:methionyl-tRNA synthetase
MFSANFWITLAVIWSLPWKGVALWKAARNRQRAWFISLLLINTLAILELTYLLWFQKNKNLMPRDDAQDKPDKNGGNYD